MIAPFNPMKDLKDIIGRAIDNYGKAAAGAVIPRKRFCFPIDSQRAADLLKIEYKKGVEARNRIFIDDNETAQRVQIAANWLTNPDCRPWLLLYGLPSTGKTILAQAIQRIAEELKGLFNPQIVQEQRCRAAGKYIPLNEEEKRLLSMCEAAVIVPAFKTARDLAKMAVTSKAEFEGAKKCDFLIIDELGEDPVSVWEWKNEYLPLTEILDYRYRAMLPTIITSNLALNNIAVNYGDRIEQRMKEMCERYHSQGDSYRDR